MLDGLIKSKAEPFQWVSLTSDPELAMNNSFNLEDQGKIERSRARTFHLETWEWGGEKKFLIEIS